MYRSHEYLFEVTEKEINSTVYLLGTTHERIDTGMLRATLYSDRLLPSMEGSNNVFYFLRCINFIDDVDHYLTQEGKDYFELRFIHKEITIADEILKQLLLANPVVNLIGQVFYGRGKISIEQVRILLNYHKVADWEISYSEIVSLLTLLNKFNILVYDKKNKGFYIKESLFSDKPISQYYITPSTPFSNIYNVRKILRSCTGDIYWIDKHFRKEGLEIILDGLPYESVNSFTILSGSENIIQSAKADYELLKLELLERSISLQWRVISDNSFKWHDRWIKADNICYNIPPVLAIIRGQRADILKTQDSLDIVPFMNKSKLIDDCSL